jgi:hypothetical protein
MADTFGTFLETLHRLESAKRGKNAFEEAERQAREQGREFKTAMQERAWDLSFKPAEALQQSAIFSIGKRLLAAGGTAMPVKAVMAKSGLSQESFFGALLAGRDKGIFQITEEGPEPVVNLTKLGSALIG